MRRGPRSADGGAAAWTEYLDRRPIVVAIAGPNGAGKTTLFESHLKLTGLRFLTADSFARELDVDAYEAAMLISALRTELVIQRESFIFETVFSDPVGDKLGFLKQAVESGYAVVLCFVGIAGPETSEQRVAMRVSQGGHDVPLEKLVQRFPRTLSNLAAAIRALPCVLIFENEELKVPFRHVATYASGRSVELNEPVPSWFKPLSHG